MARVSVIIPVHNTGKYLGPCIDSVLGQTLEDIEAIFVDDGSTDSSLSVLESAAARDSRVKVLSLSGQRGVSHARNTGIAEAVGEYLYFMDSDDWIDSDYLEVMYSLCKKESLEQVVNINYLCEYDPPRPATPANRYCVTPGYHPSKEIANFSPCYTWMRMYSRQFLASNGISFPESVSASEDMFFSKLAELIRPKVFTFSGPAYHYLNRPASLSKRNTFDHIAASKLLFDQLRLRSVLLDGIKLYYCDQSLRVDDGQQFALIRSFFREISPFWDRRYYSVFDCFCKEAVLSCPSFDEWQKRYPAGLVPAFLRSVKKGI